MFTKFFFATLISTLALNAFSSESTQAGRYRVEGPNNSGGVSVQAGRYHVASGNAGAVAIQGQESWGQIGQSQVAGRYRTGSTNFAPAAAYIAEPAYAQSRTQRGAATDVSFKPAMVSGCK